MSMTEKTSRAPRQAVRTAIIAAAVCIVLASTAFAAVYLTGGREALEQIFRIGTYDWSVTAGHRYSQEFLDMFDETYVTYVDQTVAGGDMDVTLVSVVGVQDDNSCTLGYLLRFTLPEGVTLDPEIIDNCGYGFEDKDGFSSGKIYWTRYNSWEISAAYDSSTELLPRYSVYLLETEEPGTWYGYLSEVYLDKQLFNFYDGRVTLVLGSFTDGANILVEGHWTFTFEAADLPQAKQLIDQPLATADGHGEVTSLTVSPLGVHVSLLRETLPTVEDNESWNTSTEVSFLMKNGAVRPLSHHIGDGWAVSSVSYQEERFHFLDAPIDLEQVSAVRIGEIALPLD